MHGLWKYLNTSTYFVDYTSNYALYFQRLVINFQLIGIDEVPFKHTLAMFVVGY